jgi:hypothetical protein
MRQVDTLVRHNGCGFGRPKWKRDIFYLRFHVTLTPIFFVAANIVVFVIFLHL